MWRYPISGNLHIHLGTYMTTCFLSFLVDSCYIFVLCMIEFSVLLCPSIVNFWVVIWTLDQGDSLLGDIDGDCCSFSWTCLFVVTAFVVVVVVLILFSFMSIYLFFDASICFLARFSWVLLCFFVSLPFCFLFVRPAVHLSAVMSLIVIVVIGYWCSHCCNCCCQFLSIRLVLSLFVLLVLAVVLPLAPPASIWKVDMEAAKMPTETVVLLEAGEFSQSCLFLILSKE